MRTVTSHTFLNENSFVDLVRPTTEAWDWYKAHTDGDIHIFEDSFLREHEKVNGKIKIGLLLEVPSIYDYSNQFDANMFHPYRWLRTNYKHFDYLMGPFKFLQELVGDKYIYVPAPWCRIPRESFGRYDKERMLSIIASFKQWLPGHKLRHEVIAKFRPHIDVYGNGYNKVIDEYDKYGKIIALAPYCFTIVILNDPIEDAFSEALTDALAVGTIPIFWGTKNIGQYFNPDGIIQFTDIKELDAIIPSLSKELYMSKIEAVKDNIERTKGYMSHVEWMYNHRDIFESMVK